MMQLKKFIFIFNIKKVIIFQNGTPKWRSEGGGEGESTA
jgi:hypothetical protein